MRIINDFAARFGIKFEIDERLVVKREYCYFLLNERLEKFVKPDFFYAGIYLGKVKNKRFFPSFNLLKMIAEKEANKVFVDDKSAWLFICGRDLFKRGITKVEGSSKSGAYTLVLNRHGECLGFGIILQDLDRIEKGVAVKNILDVGDFLRRERKPVEE